PPPRTIMITRIFGFLLFQSLDDFERRSLRFWCDRHLPGANAGERTSGEFAVDRRNVAESSQRRFVRADAECRHGLGSGGGRPETIPDPEHARRAASDGWQTDRAGLSHGTLGNWSVGAGGRRGISAAEDDSVCRFLLGP